MGSHYLFHILSIVNFRLIKLAEGTLLILVKYAHIPKNDGDAVIVYALFFLKKSLDWGRETN